MHSPFLGNIVHHFLATLFTKILLTEQEPSSFMVLCWNYPGSQRRWSLTTSVIPKTFCKFLAIRLTVPNSSGLPPSELCHPCPVGWTVRWASWVGTMLWFLNTIQMERLQSDFSELSHQCHTWYDQNPTCLWVAWSQEVETGRYTPKPHMREGHACKLCSMGVEDQKKHFSFFIAQPCSRNEKNVSGFSVGCCIIRA